MKKSQQLWVVGKYQGEGPWNFQGVFESEKLAEAACINEEYFMAPAVLNATLPDEQYDWPDLRYPKSEYEQTAKHQRVTMKEYSDAMTTPLSPPIMFNKNKRSWFDWIFPS
mgnify:CR=1 FL=1